MDQVIKISEISSLNRHVWVEARITINQYPKENKSVIKGALYGCYENQTTTASTVYFRNDDSIAIALGYSAGDITKSMYHDGGIQWSFSVDGGSTGELLIKSFPEITFYHLLNGSLQIYIQNGYDYIKIDSGGKQYFETTMATVDIDSFDRTIIPITADNFTDEGNPSFSYSVPNSSSSFIPSKLDVSSDTVTLQAALSFDGSTVDISYRSVPINGTNYTFNLTTEERNVIRQKAQGSDNVPIYYLLKTTYTNSSESMVFVSNTQRILTVVNCNPTLNPTVKDIKPETLALTGDENTFIRYESKAEFAINATANKYATIVSQYVQCGSKKITNMNNGVIDNVESGDFIFNVVDSRGLQAQATVFKNIINYVKPTCNQTIEVQLSGETSANISLNVSGNYYNGAFATTNNTLQIEVRYTNDNGEFGSWTTISGTPTFNGNTYSLSTTLSGFNYGIAYTFQCRVTDKLNVVQSAQYKAQLLPVFDWSSTDFNFNVPVNMNADEFSMNGDQVIKHQTNTVLAANSNGKIYFRPNGISSTSGEMILNENGKVEISGDLDINGNFNFTSFTINGDTIADYIIETGSESMGSNGTWYWSKWKSGKSECYGCRDYGRMAISTAWGNLYRSDIFAQNLPNNVFIRTPDIININLVSSSFGGWICKHENASPSAITTGSFIVVRPTSGTTTMTYIGFHIIGAWK